MTDFRLPLDDSIFRFVNGLRVDALDALFVLVSSRAFGLAVAVALALWVVIAYRGRALRPLLQAALVGGLADAVGARILKPFFARTRPAFALPADQVRVLVDVANSGSLPSNHASTAFAVATTLVLLCPLLGRVALPVATLIALSRIGVGVHWPSDVLFGAAFGAGLAVLAESGARKLLGRFDDEPQGGAADRERAKDRARLLAQARDREAEKQRQHEEAMRKAEKR